MESIPKQASGSGRLFSLLLNLIRSGLVGNCGLANTNIRNRPVVGAYLSSEATKKVKYKCLNDLTQFDRSVHTTKSLGVKQSIISESQAKLIYLPIRLKYPQHEYIIIIKLEQARN